MPFTVRAKIDGLKPILKLLDGLKKSVRGPIIRKAVDAAGKAALDAINPLVPTDTMLLKKSMGRKVKVYRNAGRAVAIVGPRTGFKVTRTAQRTARSVTGYATNAKTGKARKLILRLGSRSPVGANPTQYGHLAERGRKAVRPVNKKALSSGARVFASAGPARGAHFMGRGLAAAKGRVVGVMAAVIQAELAKVRA